MQTCNQVREGIWASFIQKPFLQTLRPKQVWKKRLSSKTPLRIVGGLQLAGIWHAVSRFWTREARASLACLRDLPAWAPSLGATCEMHIPWCFRHPGTSSRREHCFSEHTSVDARLRSLQHPQTWSGMRKPVSLFPRMKVQFGKITDYMCSWRIYAIIW